MITVYKYSTSGIPKENPASTEKAPLIANDIVGGLAEPYHELLRKIIDNGKTSWDIEMEDNFFNHDLQQAENGIIHLNLYHIVEVYEHEWVSTPIIQIWSM